MSGPLVSICIPSYNRVDLIGETIASALAQTYEHIEVIVNDNCSTDGTWQLLEELTKSDVRLKIFQNSENLGAVKNWQSVMRHAQGTFSLILWSDDLIEPTFIEKTLSAFDNDAAWVMTGVREFSDVGIYYLSDFEWEGKIPVARYFEQILFKNSKRLPVSPSCALFRSNDLRNSILNNIPNSDNIDFNRTGAGPDLLTFLITAVKYSHIVVLPEHLARFRSHPGSITVMASQASGLKLHYDWAKYYFVKQYLASYLSKFKAVTWIRYFRHGKVHKNMLSDMKSIKTNYRFMIRLFFKQ